MEAWGGGEKVIRPRGEKVGGDEKVSRVPLPLPCPFPVGITEARPAGEGAVLGREACPIVEGENG